MKSKLIIVILINLMCVFLVACQPTPEKEIVENKTQSNFDEKISQQTSNPQTLNVPENISEQVYIKEGSYSIIIDANVEELTLANYPVYSIVPSDFLQNDVDMIISYFFGDSTLYAEEYVLTKSMIEDRIVQIKADLQKIAPEDIDDIEASNQALEKLLAQYDSAPETVTRTEITSKLTIPNDVDYKTLDAFVDAGYTSLSRINISNWSPFQTLSITIDETRYFLANGTLYGETAVGQNMTLEEAKKKAVDALHDIGINDMTAVRVETGMTEDQSKQGYVVTFKRSIEGVGVAHNEITSNAVSADMAAKWPSDKITIRLDDEGISAFSWSYKGEIKEELSSNVELINFSGAMEIARQQLKNKYAWLDQSDGMQTVKVEKIVLEYTCGQQKNNPGTYLLIPAWNFYRGPEEGISANNNFYYCVLSLNAVDGTVIG